MTSDSQTDSGGVVSSTEWLDSVYDVLVKIGGADEKHPCTEWRFWGHLGFGGKYRSKTNKVDCYSEDETPKRLAIIRELNAALAKLSNDQAL